MEEVLYLLWEAVLAADPLSTAARAARLCVDPVLRSGSLVGRADQGNASEGLAAADRALRLQISETLHRAAVF